MSPTPSIGITSTLSISGAWPPSPPTSIHQSISQTGHERPLLPSPSVDPPLGRMSTRAAWGIIRRPARHCFGLASHSAASPTRPSLVGALSAR